jgi:hypothetical protein
MTRHGLHAIRPYVGLCRFIAGFSIIVCSLVFTKLAWCQEVATEQSENAERLTLALEVVDVNSGKPISGAQVLVGQVRVKDITRWVPFLEDAKLNKTFETDEFGQVTVSYPKSFEAYGKRHEVASVRVLVVHPSYVSQWILSANKQETVTVKMQAGCSIAFTALDDDSRRLKEFGVLIAGENAPRVWLQDARGEMRTNSLAKGTWQAMLARRDDQGVMLYSDVFLVPALPGKSLALRNMRLRPGLRISGQLPVSVPRPIRNGQVIAVSLPRPAMEVWDNSNPSLAWHDRVPIDEDGRYALPSLPRSGRVQLLFSCDGWISSTKTSDSGFIMGQVVDVSGEDIEYEPNMETTGRVVVTIQDTEGNPIENAWAYVQPRQQFLRGDLANLGNYALSSDLIKRVGSGQLVHGLMVPDDLQSSFASMSNAQGQVIFQNLPSDRSQVVNVWHSDYEMVGGDRWIKTEAQPGLVSEFTISMRRKADSSR